MNDYKVTVSGTHSDSEEEFASSIKVYLPTKLRKRANLEPGDRFEVRVVNNKCSIRQKDSGESVINMSGYISIKANKFKPPVLVSKSIPINYVIKDGWLAFQLPKEMEYTPKGFDLIDEQPAVKGFENV